MAEVATVMLSTEALRPGMVLAEDLVSAGGMLLAVDGTALTRRHVRQMRQWGIVGAQIKAAGAEDVTLPPLAAQTAVSHWLQVDERDPFMHELAQMARERYARHQRAAARELEGSGV